MRSFLFFVVALSLGASCAPQTARPCRQDTQCEAGERCEKDGDEVGQCMPVSALAHDGGTLLADGGRGGGEDGGGGGGPDTPDGGPSDGGGMSPPDGGSGPVRLHATEVSVGGGFVCARTEEQTVACWGYNGEGQLGRGTGLSVSTFYGPEEVPGLTDVTDLALGDNHACVIGTRSGQRGVHCWGKQSGWELGVAPGTATAGRPHPVPLPSAVHATAVEIAATATTTCARTSGGEVWCWGPDAPGSSQGEPAAATDLFDALSLEDGGGTVCARVDGWPTQCLGHPGLAHAGCGTSGVVQCGALDAVGSFSVSSWNYCDLASGALRCAGDNDYGVVDPYAPSQGTSPLTPISLEGAVDVRVGAQQACALLGTGTVRCWGRALYGSTGQPEMSGSQCAYPSTTCHPPAAVPDVTDIERFDTFSFTSCGVTSGGDVWCWGEFADESEATIAPVRYRLWR